ncbi:hypothetical protein K435DRAFT_653242 [Dendrothele bispora CBS 962.96]|uniref:Uncharacterized protein n=1 Tax=Dendrothele bispora (strain CBS 962.96) TaxID=1314807 RepID=A0A4S8MJT0_DENBC|nr:hypothetical protein K435DRAFT_653242 [Dendrothele bispora CBS 962.96]
MLDLTNCCRVLLERRIGNTGLGNEVKVEEDNDIVVAPGMSTGNTDTKYYWDLTEHILRYNHCNAGTPEAPSTNVSKYFLHIEVNSFLEIIKNFSILILNADETSII